MVEFEVLEPATVSFPDHVSQLMVINRAPFTLDIFKEEGRKGMELRHLTIIDTIVTNNTFRGMAQVLKQSPIDRFHNPFWLAERRTDTAALEDRILTKREVVSLCEKYGGNVVISLEFYTLDFEEHNDYYKDDPDVVQNHYFEVSNSIGWNIHLPENPKPFDTYTTIDTMYFSTILDGEFLPSPPASGMIRELFYYSGKKYGRYLVPVWNHASRSFYKGKGDSLKMASKYTDKGKWEDAFLIWKELTVSSDSTTISKAFHNIAIYYELEDKLDSASIMVNHALEFDTLEVVRTYREELDTRLLNQKEVRKQMY